MHMRLVMEGKKHTILQIQHSYMYHGDQIG